MDMEITVNIKEQSKIDAFLNLIKKMDYVEIVNVQEEQQEFFAEHKELLDKRLERIEKGETKYKNWNSIKTKYENKAV
jgi:hypothetical protein